MSVAVHADAKFAPPTVAATKDAFLKLYPKPISAVYTVVMQELLCQQHFMRYAKGYEYNEVMALGLVSVFDQILEQLATSEREAIFEAYIKALGEEPSKYRADAEALEEAAAGITSLSLEGDGLVQKMLARVAAKSAEGTFVYNRFFAIGLFRLLEVTGAKEPSALESLVKAVGVKPDAVNKDLMTYKSILSKMNAAKELMAEFVIREKKKQAERDADKVARKAKADAEAAGTASSSA